MTSSADSNQPVIEPQAIEDLKSLNPDDPAFLGELVDLFIQDVPLRIAEIEQAIAKQDAVLLNRAAHTIKGSCSNFGALRLHQISHVMEMQGKAATFAEAPASLVTLRAEFALVTEALKQFV